MSGISACFGIIDGAAQVLPTLTPHLTDRYLSGGTMASANSKPRNRGSLKQPVPCEACGALFIRAHGRQKRCSECRTMTCDTCGVRFIPRQGRKYGRFCSPSCRGAHPDNVARLQQVRGVKPRTYHLRQRDKYGSAADREWRVSVFSRDDYTCQHCGIRGGRLQAHHIKPYREYPELRHVLSNGETLCVDCHKKTDSYGWSKYWHKKKRAVRRLSQAVLPLEVA